MRSLTLLSLFLFLAVSPLYAEASACPLAAWFSFEEEPASASTSDDSVAKEPPPDIVTPGNSAPADPKAVDAEPAEENAKADAAPVPAPAKESETTSDRDPVTTSEPEPPPVKRPRMPVPGDCAIFRQGGEGYIFRAPTYYMQGSIVEIYRRKHYMGLCPEPGRTKANYRREDWLRFAEAYPCVTDPAKMREVEAIRVKVEVKDWDTPWSVQHGRNGWLMGGYFLDVELKEGVVVDIDGTLLERCED